MKVEVELFRKMVKVGNLKPGDCFSDGEEIGMIIDSNSLSEVDKLRPVLAVNLETGDIVSYVKDHEVIKRNCKVINDE